MSTATQTITVRLFSVLREQVGAEQLELEAHAAGTVSQALDALSGRYPPIAAYRKWIRPAVNKEYAKGEKKLVAGDELALITPVSGG